MTDTDTPTVRINIAGAPRVTNVSIEGIPSDWTDHEVQQAIVELADSGNAVAAAALRAVGTFVDLCAGPHGPVRVYLDAA